MKHLFPILLACAVLLGPVSCMKIDNFDKKYQEWKKQRDQQNEA